MSRDTDVVERSRNLSNCVLGSCFCMIPIPSHFGYRLATRYSANTHAQRLESLTGQASPRAAMVPGITLAFKSKLVLIS